MFSILYSTPQHLWAWWWLTKVESSWTKRKESLEVFVKHRLEFTARKIEWSIFICLSQQIYLKGNLLPHTHPLSLSLSIYLNFLKSISFFLSLDKQKMYIYIYIYTHVNNPWWWPMKGPKALGTILVNSSSNSNLKPRHLGNLIGS